MPRKYEMRRRAERQAETRRRIVEAAVALHEQLGPANTSISAIATRAGVERLTVYRHFPDERSLLTACTTHYAAAHPAPDIEPWRQIQGPEERLHVALREIYAYHMRTERMMVSTSQDLGGHAVLRDVLGPLLAYWDTALTVLASGWRCRNARIMSAAIGHAMAFETWQSLVRNHGLANDEAAALMVTMVMSCRDGAPEHPSIH